MNRYSHSQWRPYIPVAYRRRQASKRLVTMRKSGRAVVPINIIGRKIATTFWGDAWCKNLEAYSDYSNRLPRGRTYVRNGSVIDLKIEAGHVEAVVSGSDIYDVDIEIDRLPRRRWTRIKRICAGRIDSLVELLKGTVSKGVMEVVTRQGEGLFPSPQEISLKCSCPDWASMCKHVAAALYGVGARLDHEPALLFTLRCVDPAEMVSGGIDLRSINSKPRQGRVLAADRLSTVFGVDIDVSSLSPQDASDAGKPDKRTRRKLQARRKATSSTSRNRKATLKPAVRRSAARSVTRKRSLKKAAGKKTTLSRAASRKVASRKSSSGVKSVKKRRTRKAGISKTASRKTSPVTPASRKTGRKAVVRKSLRSLRRAKKK